MERIQVQFQDCDISGEEKSRIIATISYHLGSGPSDATSCCCISHNREQYVCNMRVHSAKGHFHIHRESKTLPKLLEFIYDSLNNSFRQWHSNPSHFSKNHPLGATPCRDEEHNVLSCPFQSYANKKFETKK